MGKDDNNVGNRGKGKAKSRIKQITVTYENESPSGLWEKALADIYIKKVKNGTLKIR